MYKNKIYENNNWSISFILQPEIETRVILLIFFINIIYVNRNFTHMVILNLTLQKINSNLSYLSNV